ncbi:PilZ domain-containing protein [Aestuariispira insulae]|uniref:PilZ domain-containing protein n=1 Tax=Aestuariispira insulae TaxID=1461337 RepID=A0A3D9HXI8_9PROT|nr:PilZ domain-containing protein [Aestuariispira insulae]RED53616.1 PilZ domain-containing protein [Aestuariispira insulae]
MTDRDNRNTPPRRDTPRHMASFQAMVETVDGGHVCTVVNLSRDGAMVKGAIDNEAGSLVIIDIPKIGRLKAMVAWNDGETFGLSFDFKRSPSPIAPENVEETVRELPPQSDRRKN